LTLREEGLEAREAGI
jgi:hypothetical protein